MSRSMQGYDLRVAMEDQFVWGYMYCGNTRQGTSATHTRFQAPHPQLHTERLRPSCLLPLHINGRDLSVTGSIQRPECGRRPYALRWEVPLSSPHLSTALILSWLQPTPTKPNRPESCVQRVPQPRALVEVPQRQLTVPRATLYSVHQVSRPVERDGSPVQGGDGSAGGVKNKSKHQMSFIARFAFINSSNVCSHTFA